MKRRIAIKYGRSVSVSINNGLAKGRVTDYVNGAEANTFEDYVERVPVSDITNIHAEFLKLLDSYAKGECESIGVQLIERSNKPQFLDKYWTVRKTMEVD